MKHSLPREKIFCESIYERWMSEDIFLKCMFFIFAILSFLSWCLLSLSSHSPARSPLWAILPLFSILSLSVKSNLWFWQDVKLSYIFTELNMISEKYTPFVNMFAYIFFSLKTLRLPLKIRSKEIKVVKVGAFLLVNTVVIIIVPLPDKFVLVNWYFPLLILRMYSLCILN